jgi:hypothetical protein
MEAHFKDHKQEFQSKAQFSGEYFVVGDEEAASEMAREFAANPKLFDERREGKESFSGEIRNSELRAAFAAIKPGEIHKTPFKTQSMGFIIGRLTSSGPVREPSLKDVEAQVRQAVLRQRKDEMFDEWLTEIRNQAEIIRRPAAPGV